MIISTIIPCAWHHFNLLDLALTKIAQGTEMPNEVIVLISGVNELIKEQWIEKLQRKFNSLIELKIIMKKEGWNISCSKNELVKLSKGDIIICHDADDYQHPQRVEIVKKIFDENDIVYFCHSYRFFDEPSFKQINFKDIKIISPAEINEKYLSHIAHLDPIEFFNLPFNVGDYLDNMGKVIREYFIRSHDGACVFKKEIMQKVKWNENRRRGQDKEFFFSVLKEFQKSMFVDSILYSYKTKEHHGE